MLNFSPIIFFNCLAINKYKICILKILKSMGAKAIYVIDPINYRVQHALKNGAEHVFKSVDDFVQYTDNGIVSTYIAVATSTNQAPSTSGTENSTYWKFMAKGVADSLAGLGNNKIITDFTTQSAL